MNIIRIAFHEKSSFPKKVNVLKPNVLRSRMRVREGSPKKREIKNMEIMYKTIPKIGFEKGRKIRAQNTRK